jgi:predicted nucleic acid-binding protein
MRLGIDTNVLVYAHVHHFPDHARVSTFLENALADPRTRLCIPTRVLDELLHVLTDARRFDPPVTMDQARDLVRVYLNRSNVEIVPVDEHAVSLALEMMERHGLGRNRVGETMIAASLLSSGVRDLVTCNPDDFKPFEAISLHDPRRT